MFDYKITSKFIRGKNFRNELASVMDAESMEYKLIMHYRFQMLAVAEQCWKLDNKMNRLYDDFKKDYDQKYLNEIHHTAKELRHHKTKQENLKFTIRGLLCKSQLI